MEEYLKGSTDFSIPGHTTQDLNHCLDGILGLLKLVTSRSEQLANALHVMVRMLARLLHKIIHPQTIRSVFRGKVLVIKNGTRIAWIGKGVCIDFCCHLF